MNAEAQRIAIAEACGILNCITVIEAWKRDKPTRLDGYREGQRVTIPDYLNDLNAIHHAVKSLPQNLMPRYFACLCNVVSGSISLYGYSKATEATAAQRCEAFLKTLDKWINDN